MNVEYWHIKEGWTKESKRRHNWISVLEKHLEEGKIEIAEGEEFDLNAHIQKINFNLLNLNFDFFHKIKLYLLITFLWWEKSKLIFRHENWYQIPLLWQSQFWLLQSTSLKLKFLICHFYSPSSILSSMYKSTTFLFLIL